MYLPQAFAADAEATLGLLAARTAADLITVTDAGLAASTLPFVHDRQAGEHGRLLGHLARDNDHWRRPAVGDALVILRGPQAYVSPNWYPSKATHGRVVPTWNYVIVHVHGELVVHDDPAWVEDVVRRLTTMHEADQPRPWSVEDAPEAFIAGQLKGIVGIEIRIRRVEAKAKLSQNRSHADRTGVIDALHAAGETATAEAMRHASRPD